MSKSNTIYQKIKIQVSNAQPGQNVGVAVTGNGTQIAFSTGPDFSNYAGIQVQTTSGSDLPLETFSINPSETKFTTSSQSGGSSLTFTLTAYLVAEENTTTFYLKSISDNGVEVQAAIGDATPQIINQSNTLFPWNPA
jgi:hypothetical protein